MPIRFECDQCGQRLSIARRKAGTEIGCPTCGVSQRVPIEPSAEQEVEEIGAVAVEEEPVSCLDEPATAEDLDDEVMDAEVDEDQQPLVFGPSADRPPILDEVDLSKTIDLNYPPVASAVSADVPPPPPLPSEAERDQVPPTPRLPIPWAIYAQALLLLCVAVGALSAGYYWGYQDGSAVQIEPSEQAVAVAEPQDGFADEEVLLDGRILWTPSPGTSSGDASASFVALPQDRIPHSSLPMAGLQPGSEDSADTQASVAAIRAIGGVFTRAESDGTLAAVLPREGRYYLLVISRNVLRQEDQPILARDLAQMKQYFAVPEGLIGASKYVWQPAELRVGAPAVEHDFGLDGL
jgi:predicted  nucleic acid-binding Zn-ribbon protein